VTFLPPALIAGFADLALFAEGEPPFWVQSLPFVVLIGLFYFVMMRPMQKEREQRQALISALKKNDRVVTSSGLVGVVVSIKPDEGIVTLRMSHEDTKVDVIRSSIARILTEEPADKPDNP
jgi:preprotein translocase subunit YajC